VIDLRTMAVVFKAKYKDAAGKVARLFYIEPKRVFGGAEESESEEMSEKEEEEEEEEGEKEGVSRFKDDEIMPDEEEEEEGNGGKEISDLRMRTKRLPLF